MCRHVVTTTATAKWGRRMPVARSLLLGARLAEVFEDRDRAASLGLQLRRLYPASQEYQQYVSGPVSYTHLSSSLATEWMKGKTLDEAESIKNTQLAEELALPPVKIHCSVLAEDAIKAAVRDYKQKKGLL